MFGPRAKSFLNKKLHGHLGSALEQFFFRNASCGQCENEVPMSSIVWCVHCGTIPTCSQQCMFAHLTEGPETCSLIKEMTPHGQAITRWYQRYGRILGAIVYTTAALEKYAVEDRSVYCRSHIAFGRLGCSTITAHVPRTGKIIFEDLRLGRARVPFLGATSILGSRESSALDIGVRLEFRGRRNEGEMLGGYPMLWRMRLEWPEVFHGIDREVLTGLLAEWIADTASLEE